MSQDEPPTEEENLPDLRARKHDPAKPGVSDRLRRRLGTEFRFGIDLAKRWALRLVFIILHILIILAGFYAVVWWNARGTCYRSVDRIPVRMVGLVLGCVKKTGSRDNLYFNTRIDAAEKLFKAGKVQYLIVSGDNHRNGYDEPTDMKAALVARGIPADHIYCDYAGLRTLDSVIRAQKVFGQDDCTIVSQRFHNERALYIAHRTGMPDAVAFDAEAVNTGSTLWMNVREIFARFMAVCDVEFFQRQPKFLGARVRIGPKDPPVDAQPVPGVTK